MLGLSVHTAGTVSRKAGFSSADDDLFGSLLELTRGGRVVVLVAYDSQSGQGNVHKCTDVMGLVGSMMDRIWMNVTTGTCWGQVFLFRDGSILAIGVSETTGTKDQTNKQTTSGQFIRIQ